MSGTVRILVNDKQVFENHNTITNLYRNIVARLLAGEMTGFQEYCAIGLGTTAPTTNDSALEDEIDRIPVTYRFTRLSYYTRLNSVFDVTSPPVGPGTTQVPIREVGLFTGGPVDVTNSSFDTWAGTPPTGWGISGGSLVKSSDGYDGTAAATVIGTATGTAFFRNYIGGSPGVPTGTPDYTDYRGRLIDFVAPVKCGSANIARVYLNDGMGISYSDYHSGGGSYERIRVSRLMDDSADRFEVGLSILGAGSATIDWAKATERGDLMARATVDYDKGSANSILVQWDIFQEETL